MSKINAVFLIFSERSGSNLISVNMDAHPLVVAPPTLHLFREVVGWADSLVDTLHDKVAKQSNLYLKSNLKLFYNAKLVEKIIQHSRQSDPISVRDMLRSIYRLILERYGAAVTLSIC